MCPSIYVKWSRLSKEYAHNLRNPYSIALSETSIPIVLCFSLFVTIEILNIHGALQIDDPKWNKTQLFEFWDSKFRIRIVEKFGPVRHACIGESIN